MNSLSSILAPQIERVSRARETEAEVEESPKKRVKSTSPQAMSSSPAHEGLKDKKKARWLAGLSHQELLGVAQGAVWQGMSRALSEPHLSFHSPSTILVV